MTQQEIHEHLDKMLTNPKMKNFLNHLIRAYFPITSVNKVWDRPTNNFKCVITGDELFSVQDILEGVRTEEFKADFMENIKDIFNKNVDTTTPMIKLIGDRKMGFIGTNTTTYMSYTTVQEFYNWVLTKSLKNDKHINWLLRSIRKETTGEITVQHNRPKKAEPNKNMVATYTLGETDTFKKLKEKLN